MDETRLGLGPQRPGHYRVAGTCRPAIRLRAWLMALACAPLAAWSDSTLVFRCVTDHGREEFRQGPCPSGLQQELQIEDVQVGWDAPAVKVEMPKRRKTSSGGNSSGRKDTQREKCFKTEQRVEDINRQLRRGYTARQGDNLRHRRRQYEAYMDRFCP